MTDSKDRAQSLFLNALEIATGRERAAYIEAECGADGKLRSEVEELLEHAQRLGRFLDPGEEGTPPTIDQPRAESPGMQIGPYKLLQQIGEGGFGTVYMAEQKEPVRRKVALKIIKLGMDTGEVIARFEAERQALAMMDHPNIAKVLDAGATETGRPYFVMELVKGVVVTEFCDKNQLPTRDRLRLFATICQAVQHAHQKGVIHRDIKPSNIMVTLHDGKPVPIVIDFGVAKAISHDLTARTLFTTYGQMVGTPQYMSPEQAEMSGLDVDTRSDVYSLGVLLYELLTGTTPLEAGRLREAGYAEMQRIIREEEPQKPSLRLSTLGEELTIVARHQGSEPGRLRHVVRGELDWIVMKALEKERGRRYETANGFAADIERYLNDEPVVAYPPTATYRFKKFARRNKAALAAAALVVAALLLGIAGTTWQSVRATQAEEEAKTERDTANVKRIEADRAKRYAVIAESAERQQREKVTRLLASSYVTRGQSLCRQGKIGQGMIWLAHSLRVIPDKADDLQRLIRANLAAWSIRLHPLRTLLHTQSEIVAAELSPDGSRILTGSTDGILRLWDAAAGRQITESAHRHEAWAVLPNWGHFRCAAFSPDGSRILTASHEGTAHLWNATTLEPVGKPLQHLPVDASLEAKYQVRIVAFSPDGSRIATASGIYGRGLVRLWDSATQEPLGDAVEVRDPVTVRFCPDDLCVLVWDRSSGSQLWNVDRDEPIGPSLMGPRARHAAISPDGSVIATYASSSGLIELWQAETGDPAIDPIIPKDGVSALAFSPDGTRLLIGGSARTSELWDVTTGRKVGASLRQRSRVSSVAFSADGTRVLTGNWDGSVRIWDVAQDRIVGQAIRHDDAIVAAGCCSRGVRMLTERDGLFQLRDASTGRTVGKPFQYQCAADKISMALSPDGSKILIQRGSQGRLLDVASGTTIDHTDIKGLMAAAFGPDSSRIFLSIGRGRSSAGRGQLSDTSTLECLGKLMPYPRNVVRAVFDADGSCLLTGSTGGTSQLWDARTLEPLGEPVVHQDEITALAISSDGRQMLVGFADGTARLWNLASKAPVGMSLQHDNSISDVAFSADGSRLLTCTEVGNVQLWDTATQQRIGPEMKHDGRSPEACFVPNGAELFVASEDGVAMLWQAPTGPVEGELDRILLWTDVMTGLTLTENQVVETLDSRSWQNRYRRLQDLGGPPTMAPIPPAAAGIETKFRRSMRVALRGHVHAASGKWEEAVTDFISAIELGDGSPTLRTQIACWWSRLADGHLASARHEDCERSSRRAIALLEKLIEDNPSQPELVDQLERQYDRLVRLFRGTGRPEDELGMRRQRLTLYKQLAGRSIGWRYRRELGFREVSLGTQLEQMGRTQLAEEHFANGLRQLERVIEELGGGYEFRAELAESHCTIARAYANAGRPEKALDSFHRALELNPASPARTFLSHFLMTTPNPKARDPAESVRQAAEATRRNPGHHWRLHALRVSRDALKRSVAEGEGGRKAVDSFLLAIANWHLGDELEAYRRYFEAQDLMEQSTTEESVLRDVQTEATELLGWADRLSPAIETAVRAGDQGTSLQWDEAIAGLTKAIERAPDNWRLRAVRAAAEAHRGRWEQVVDDLTRAIQLEPETLSLWRNRAKANAMLGRWGAAAADLVYVVQRDPRDETAWRTLAALQLHADNVKAYQQTCLAAFQALADGHMWQKASLVQICSLAPDSGIDRWKLTTLADSALGEADNAIMQLTKGMDDYRSGRFEEAVTRLPKSGDPLVAPLTLFFQAMSHHRLDDPERARKLLGRGIKTMNRRVPTIDGPPLSDRLPDRWMVWCVVDAVRREAEKLIGAKNGKPMSPGPAGAKSEDN